MKVKVLIPTPGVKPVPVTVTVIPCGPWSGDSEIAGAVIVNVAEAASPVTVPASVPAALTVYPLAPLDGTLKVQENVPVDEVVWEVQVCVAGVAPLKVNVAICVFIENPVPETETVTPCGPCDGFMVMAAVVGVKATEMMKLVPDVPCDTTT